MLRLWRLVLTMLAFCLGLSLLAATPAFSECDCDQDRDQEQVRDCEDGDKDQDRDRLGAHWIEPEVLVVEEEGGVGDRIRLQLRDGSCVED